MPDFDAAWRDLPLNHARVYTVGAERKGPAMPLLVVGVVASALLVVAVFASLLKGGR